MEPRPSLSPSFPPSRPAGAPQGGTAARLPGVPTAQACGGTAAAKPLHPLPTPPIPSSTHWHWCWCGAAPASSSSSSSSPGMRAQVMLAAGTRLRCSRGGRRLCIPIPIPIPAAGGGARPSRVPESPPHAWGRAARKTRAGEGTRRRLEMHRVRGEEEEEERERKRGRLCLVLGDAQLLFAIVTVGPGPTKHNKDTGLGALVAGSSLSRCFLRGSCLLAQALQPRLSSPLVPAPGAAPAHLAGEPQLRR